MNSNSERNVADCHCICTLYDLLDLENDARSDRLAEIIRALEEKFPYNRAHSDRVLEVTKVIAEELPIPEEELVAICRAACLHDVGKVAVPGEILTKPGSLTRMERRIIEKHPESAARLLKRLAYPDECIELVYHHHEWFNGEGYPSRAEGEEIPLGSRVIAVADAFDAMTSDRPYRKAMSLENARRELYDCAGSQFDPEVVEALDRAFENSGIIEDKLCLQSERQDTSTTENQP